VTSWLSSGRSTEQPAATLSSRREILFLYDTRMGNPNGDPDENRPRQLPDGTFYVTDVRLKRFARDYLKLRGEPLLVDRVDGRTTNLTARVRTHLERSGKKEAKGKELVSILLDSFVDARLFGSSFAFKDWDDADPEPKTLTGAVQLNHGEVLHPAEEVIIKGTSLFGSDEGKSQGTFTEYACLRYALVGFSGVANEHSAKLSRMTDADYDALLRALWNGVRSAANTRTKTQQSPRLLVDVRYNAVQALHASPAPLPARPSARVVRDLLDRLGARTSERFQRLFRDTAVLIGLAASQEQAAFARRQARATAPRSQRVDEGAPQKGNPGADGEGTS
jgi:CRISPR-associated protein Csh2